MKNLVLEFVTLHLKIQIVIEVLIDFASITVTLKETTQNTNTTHPENLATKTSFASTTTLTYTSVTTLALCFELI